MDVIYVVIDGEEPPSAICSRMPPPQFLMASMVKIGVNIIQNGVYGL